MPMLNCSSINVHTVNENILLVIIITIHSIIIIFHKK